MPIVFLLLTVFVVGVLNFADTVDATKIKWDANGGKIGSKNTISTTMGKSAKVGEFPTKPKRSGYTFKGWVRQA